MLQYAHVNADSTENIERLVNDNAQTLMIMHKICELKQTHVVNPRKMKISLFQYQFSQEKRNHTGILSIF